MAWALGVFKAPQGFECPPDSRSPVTKLSDSTVGAEQAHGYPGVQFLSVLAEHSLHEETCLGLQLGQANDICSFQLRITCDVLWPLPADAGLALFLSTFSLCLPIQQAE